MRKVDYCLPIILCRAHGDEANCEFYENKFALKSCKFQQALWIGGEYECTKNLEGE